MTFRATEPMSKLPMAPSPRPHDDGVAILVVDVFGYGARGIADENGGFVHELGRLERRNRLLEQLLAVLEARVTSSAGRRRITGNEAGSPTSRPAR